MTQKTKRIAALGLLASLAVILSYVEAILPPLFSAVPGIKMGLPNLVILFLLYRFSLAEAATVSLIRLGVTFLLFGNFPSFLYSLAGAVLSLTLMYLLKKTDRFSTVGVSVAGGVAHNLGQILVAVFLLQTAEIAYYMIILAVSGTVAGALIGLTGAALLKHTAHLKL